MSIFFIGFVFLLFFVGFVPLSMKENSFFHVSFFFVVTDLALRDED
jgi:hypothetical protein